MPVVGTAALVGAAVGAGTALITGGNILKGALFGGITGAAGGALGGAFAGEAGGVTAAGEAGIDSAIGGVAIDSAAADTAGLAQMAADAGLTGDAAAAFADSGGALGSSAADATAAGTSSGLNVPEPTQLAAPPPVASDTTGQVAAKGLVDQSGTASAPQAPNAPSAPTPPSPSVTNAPQGIIQQGMQTTPPPAPPAPDAAYETSGVTDLASRTADTALDTPGMLDRALEWADAHPALAKGALQAGGNLVGGVGKGIGDYQTAVTKATLDEKNKEKLIQAYRAFVQQGSTGGVGVNVGVNPSTNAALRRPNGGLVFNAMGLNR